MSPCCLFPTPQAVNSRGEEERKSWWSRFNIFITLFTNTDTLDLGGVLRASHQKSQVSKRLWKERTPVSGLVSLGHAPTLSGSWTVTVCLSMWKTPSKHALTNTVLTTQRFLWVVLGNSLQSILSRTLSAHGTLIRKSISQGNSILGSKSKEGSSQSCQVKHRMPSSIWISDRRWVLSTQVVPHINMSEIQTALATLHFYVLNLAIPALYPFCRVPKPGVFHTESGWLMKTGRGRK